MAKHDKSIIRLSQPQKELLLRVGSHAYGLPEDKTIPATTKKSLLKRGLIDIFAPIAGARQLHIYLTEAGRRVFTILVAEAKEQQFCQHTQKQDTSKGPNSNPTNSAQASPFVERVRKLFGGGSA